MTMDIVLGWPQVVVLLVVLARFGVDCVKAARATEYGWVDALIGFLWLIGSIYVLNAGGFFSPH